MFKQQEKQFFADTAKGAGRLSECPIPRGAVVIKDKQILSYGFNRRILRNKKHEISAIYDAIFSVPNKDLTLAVLFSTHFPTLDDMKLIISCGIVRIYFFGEIDDPYAVEIANNASQESIKIEFIKLL